jgi:hypothetical protein
MAARWIKCTGTNQKPVYINMDAALTLTEIAKTTSRGRFTRVALLGGNDSHVDVDETPEQLIAMAGGQRDAGC